MEPAPARQAGYTIVEVMIFLVISSALLMLSLGAFDNRIQNTEFTQSAEALTVRVKSVANQASTGTYLDKPSFSCTVNLGSGPDLSPLPSGDNQGTRNDCIFAGKVMNFTVQKASEDCIADESCQDVDVYTAVGRRQSSPGVSVTDLINAKPTLVLTPNLTETKQIGYGTRVTAVYFRDSSSGTLTPISAVGFFQSFGGSYSGGNLTSGSQNVEAWYVKASPTVAPLTDSAVSDALINAATLIRLDTTGGILICLHGDNSSQKASISLGIENSNFSATTKIGDSTC